MRKRQGLFYVGSVRVEEDGSFTMLDLDGQPNVKDIIAPGDYEYMKVYLLAVDTDRAATAEDIEWAKKLTDEWEKVDREI